MEFIIHSKKYGDKTVLIDDEDYNRIKDYKWHISKDNYIDARIKKEDGRFSTIGLHRVIMYAPKGMSVDHINHNRLDNRKENLRICSHSENLKNYSKPKDGKTSQYKGVCWDKNNNRFKAALSFNCKTVYIGLFKDEVSAALAYNKKAKELFGEFANLNIIDKPKEARDEMSIM